MARPLLFLLYSAEVFDIIALLRLTESLRLIY